MARRPVNAPYTITTEFGVRDSYAKFGYHSGVDYAVPLNRPIYAPVSGQLTNVVSPTGGNMVVIKDNQGFTHRLMHNNSFSRGNGWVNEGDQVALAGTTGLSTGVHSHWDINKEGTYPTSFAAFISPADWLAGKYQQVTPPVVAGGNNVFNTDAEVQEAYLMLRGNPGTAAERAGWIGQSKQRFFQVGRPEADATRTRLANAEKTVATLNSQVSSLNTKVSQLTTQVTTLTNQVKALTTTIATKDKEIADLKAQVAAGGSNEDSINLNKLGEALRWVISRLGLK
jgi:uncharacterized coiled-coil protein SlyX